MEAKHVVNVSDINRKRPSLKNPEDMKRMLELKHKSLQFELDPIKETQEKEEVSNDLNDLKEKKVEVKPQEDKFLKQRRESLRNEFKIAQELL